MTQTKAQRKASLAYKKKRTKTLCITLFPADEDIIQWLDGINGKAAYIRRLIREDIKRRGY